MRLRTVTYNVPFYYMPPGDQERTRRAWDWLNELHYGGLRMKVDLHPNKGERITVIYPGE